MTEGQMQIPKDQILDFLRNQGKHDEAAKAEKELPDQVDHEQHADLLSKFGIEPQELISKVGGRLGL
jgi:F0F1-type ATP synthase membrane subunit b/b'